MRSNYVRIVISDNKTYLVYNRGLVWAMVGLFGRRALVHAYQDLRQEIGRVRRSLRICEYREPNHILQLLERKREAVVSQAFEGKRPIGDTRHVGVEIEFLSQSDRKQIARDLVKQGLQAFVELKSDGSVSGDPDGASCDGSCRDNCECYYCGETHYCDDIDAHNRRNRNNGDDVNWVFRDDCSECDETETLEDCDCGGKNELGESVCNGEHIVCSGHCDGHNCAGYDDHDNWDCQCECDCGDRSIGHEIAIVATRSKIRSIVTRVCKVLAMHDAEVNNTCGLHVHIDMRGDNEELAFKNLVRCQKLLYSMVPRSRYKNQYCRPNVSTDMSEHDGRYWGINPASYEEHQTIEVRLHSGSVNAEKIGNWIQLLTQIAYCRKELPKLESLKDLTTNVIISKPLLAYIKERIGKFAGEHGSYSLPLTKVSSRPNRNVETTDLALSA